MNSSFFKEFLNQYEAPIYLYNLEKISDQYDVLQSAILKGSSIYYSMKANPNKEICKFLLNKGSKIEVASLGEYRQAIKAGANGNDIIFTGPGKTSYELKEVINKGIGIINIECLEEAKIINRIAEEYNKTISIALRINPSEKLSNAKIKMSGVSSQFGIEEILIDEDFIDTIKSLKSVKIVGIQIYMGTNILDAEDIERNTEYIIKTAIRIEQMSGINFSYINFGGGFGVPYFDNEKKLDIVALKKSMETLSDKYKYYLDGKKLVFESGRFLVAEAGEYLIKVLYVKSSKGKKYVVCNGGSNFHAASAFLGRFVRNNYPISLLNNTDVEKETMTLVGPLCTPTDILGKDIQFPTSIKSGDIVAIHMSGAYGLTYSPCLFLRHEMPLEVAYKNGEYIDISE